LAESVLVLEAQAKAALPIIESAWRHGRRVIAAAPVRCCTGLFSRYPGERLVYPSPIASPQAFRDWLAGTVQAKRPDMTYPTGDPVTAACAEMQDDLVRSTRLVLPPADVFRVGRSKALTLQAAHAAGVPIPDTWYVGPPDLAEVARQVRYPSLIKPSVSAGARGITRVESAAELVQKFPAIVDEYGECFVQDYVPQTGMQYKVDILIDHGAEVHAGVVYEKLRYYPPNGGSSVLNRTVERPDILCAAVDVARQIGWHGFCDFDFITDPRDGRVKLMEINPRFPESMRATVAAGLDMVEMMWEMAHGRQPAAATEVKVGQYVRFLPGDVMWLLTAKNRRGQFRSWLRFFGRDLHYQVCSWRDPGAIVGYLAENTLLLFDRKKRAHRFRTEQARRG